EEGERRALRRGPVPVPIDDRLLENGPEVLPWREAHQGSLRERPRLRSRFHRGGSCKSRAVFGAVRSARCHASIGPRRPCSGRAGADRIPAFAAPAISTRGAQTMGLTDFLKGQFIDDIEWTDDSRDTLSFRYPDEDKEIKNGAQLIVRESQVVQFVYLGEFGDTFGPGKHTLPPDNIPILTSLKSWKYAF